MCTKIQFKTRQGSVIVARTGEFEAYCKTETIFLPIGSKVNKWVNRDDLFTFETELAMVGTITPFLSNETLLDGMNEKGLVFNTNYYSKLTKYKEFSESEIDESFIDFTVLPTLLLSKCSTIDEVKSTIENLKDHIGVLETNINHPYWHSITDAAGNTVVIQMENEVVVVKDNNKYGVLTNPPKLEDHISNADKYMEGRTNVDGKNTVSNSSTMDLPGGFDAASRFLRAVHMTKFMEPVNEGNEAINLAFRILHTSDSVPGTALVDIRDDKDYEGAQNLTYSESKEGHIFYHTDVSIVSDTKELKYYWTTYDNLIPRYVDLKKLIQKGEKVKINRHSDLEDKFIEIK